MLKDELPVFDGILLHSSQITILAVIVIINKVSGFGLTKDFS